MQQRDSAIKKFQVVQNYLQSQIVTNNDIGIDNPSSNEGMYWLFIATN